MRQPPVIIGAGPAGCAAAIRLARAGHPPIVLERTTGPSDKVCGDFLSGDTIRLLDGIGIDPYGLGAAPLRRVRLVHRGRSVQTELPFAAIGLSRRRLDAALVAAAEVAGTQVRLGRTVRHLAHEPGGGWLITAGGDAPLRAETVFLATGKHDLRDWPRLGRGRGAVGMKMYYRPDAAGARHLRETIELTPFPGGYAGVQPVEDGRLVLCCTMAASALRRLGGWHGLLAHLAAANPATLELLRQAQPLLPKPLAVANVPYGYLAHPAAAEALFRLGDQAAVIPSLAGDGMAIALHSGEAAARAWIGGTGAGDWQDEVAAMLRPQVRLAMLLHHALRNRSSQGAAAWAAGTFPGLLSLVAGRTRLNGAAMWSDAAAIGGGVSAPRA